MGGEGGGPAPARTVLVGLLADPDLPAEIAGRLAGELPRLLSLRVSDGVAWEVQVVSDRFESDEPGELPIMAPGRLERLPDDRLDGELDRHRRRSPRLGATFTWEHGDRWADRSGAAAVGAVGHP